MYWHNKDFLFELYVQQKKTIREIAKMVLVSPSTIRYWLKKNNIKLRCFNIGDVNRGKSFTKAEKDLLSLQTKTRYKYNKHPREGTHHSEESKIKISKSLIRRNQCDDKTDG